MNMVIGLLISVLVYGLFFWLLLYLVGMLPEPMQKMARIIIVVIAIIVVLSWMAGFLPLVLPPFRSVR